MLGRDYNLKFAAVLDMTSGKIIVAVDRLWDVRASHFDVPSAYLKAYKEEEIEIYMRVLEGMTISVDQLRRLNVTDASDTCLRLIKGLYGLKQAGLLCNQLLDQTLNDAGFAQSGTDA